MTRDDALSYLKANFAELAVEANWDEGTKLSTYRLLIDQSLRELNVAEDALGSTTIVGTDNIIAYHALLDFYALLRFSTVFSVRADVSVTGAISASQSQIWRQVRSMLSRAEDRLTGLGLSTTEQVIAGYFTLDYLEPGPWGAHGNDGGMG